MIPYLLIYLLGFLVTLFLVFLENKYNYESASFKTAIIAAIFSWGMVIVYLIIKLDQMSLYQKFDSWFRNNK